MCLSSDAYLELAGKLALSRASLVTEWSTCHAERTQLSTSHVCWARARFKHPWLPALAHCPACMPVCMFSHNTPLASGAGITCLVPEEMTAPARPHARGPVYMLSLNPKADP